jgi:putative tryptophan/tyrosine transport system substrate-binding protein
MRRREFITLAVGAAASCSVAARAQQPALPLIGYLHASSPEPMSRFISAFKGGLKESGYIDGQNVTIEFRFAEGHPDRLPALAAELVRRQVTVIATGGAEFPTLAAKAATKTIPIVFVTGTDPVKLGLVSSLARPAGNITGIQMFTTALENKRFGLLHEVVPNVSAVAALIDPSRAVVAQAQVAELVEAANAAGVRLIVVNATTEADFVPAFAKAIEDGAGAMQVCANPNFFAMREQLVPLAARYRLPTIYEWREFTYAGGLMSYGTDLADAYRLEGGYVAKILKGAKPADLPIMQSTKFEFVINLKTAKALGLTIPPGLLSIADEVIE